jgi:hypothetical protein
MPLKFEKDSKKKNVNGIILENGIYKVKIIENEDKEDEGEKSKRKGYFFHNLRMTFENNKSIFCRVYYQNEEGNIVPAGYNFLLGLKNVLLENTDDPGKKEKIETADTNKIIDKLIKDKIHFYVATKLGKFNGEDITNINTFIEPMASLQEAEEMGEKKKLNVKSLLKEEDEAVEAEIDDDDDDDDDDDL